MSQGPQRSASVREAESILEQLAASALDDDYYVEHPTAPSTTAKVMTGVVAGLFGLLLTVAAVQTRNDRPATEAERGAVIEGIQLRQELVGSKQQSVMRLQQEIADLQATVTGDAPGIRALRISTGAVAVTGPGMVVQLASSDDDEKPFGQITDTDVQLAVNGLWLAGAEAVSIDGHRLTSTSAIRSAGEAITVNYRSVTEPIVISAIGDPDTIVDQWRKGPSGRYMTNRADDDGISYAVRGSDQIRLAAAPESRLTVSATPLRSAS